MNISKIMANHKLSCGLALGLATLAISALTVSAQTAPRVGQLIFKTDKTVYAVSADGLYGFPDIATFYSWNNQAALIYPANSAESALGQIGIVVAKTASCNNVLDACGHTPASAATSPRVGQLVYNPSSQTVYYVGSTGLYGFPDAATFYSWGYTFNQILSENTAEAALSQVGIVPTKQAGCSDPVSQLAGNCGTTSAPVIASLAPLSGPAGTQVAITGSGFTSANNIKLSGPASGTAASMAVSADGKTLAFAIPATIALMPDCFSGACPQWMGVSQSVNPGRYSVTVTNVNGTSNPQVFTITAASTATSPRVGQLVYNPSSQTVYYVGQSGLYGFPDAATFYSWGYTFNQILSENTAEAALSQVGIVPTKQAGCSDPVSQLAGNCGTNVSNGNNQNGNTGNNASAGSFVSSGTVSISSPGPNHVYKVGDLVPISWNVTDQSYQQADIVMVNGYEGTYYSSFASSSSIILTPSPLATAVSNTGSYAFPLKNLNAVGINVFPAGPYRAFIRLYKGCLQQTATNPNHLGFCVLDGWSASFIVKDPTLTQVGAAGAPHIDSISPSSGKIGDTITLRGTGFSNCLPGGICPGGDTDIAVPVFTLTSASFFSGVSISGVHPSDANAKANMGLLDRGSSDSSIFIFAIPLQVSIPCGYFTFPNGNEADSCNYSGSAALTTNIEGNIAPGTYTIQMRNTQGISNAVTFTVTSN